MFELWKKLHLGPQHLPMEKDVWEQSMYEDVDSDGRKLFEQLHTDHTAHAMVQYGHSAFGFDENGEISNQIHYPIIRDLAFEPEFSAEGEKNAAKGAAEFHR